MLNRVALSLLSCLLLTCTSAAQVPPEFRSFRMPSADVSSSGGSTRSTGSFKTDADSSGWERIAERIRQPTDRLSVAPRYYGEVFSNTKGGLSTNGSTKYQGLLDLPFVLDLTDDSLLIPGKFVLLAQNTHGRGITEDFVGDSQVLSGIDSRRNIMRVSEYWWQLNLFDGDLLFRFGKQDLNTEFLVVRLAEDFVHSAFGLSPAAALPSFPDPSWAAVMLADLSENLVFRVGVWDAVATAGNWGFTGNDTILFATELEFTYRLDAGRLPGVLTVGAGYSNGGVRGGVAFSQAHGYLFQLEQILWRERPGVESAKPQGLGAFISYFPRFASVRAPDSIGDNYVAGVIYRGLFDGRDDDVIGLGVAWAELFKGGSGEETAVELFYKAQVTPDLSVQPDLQYISTPSGIYRDAFAVGLRFEWAL